jgi:hypothetical protein
MTEVPIGHFELETKVSGLNFRDVLTHFWQPQVPRLARTSVRVSSLLGAQIRNKMALSSFLEPYLILFNEALVKCISIVQKRGAPIHLVTPYSM